MYKKSAEGWLKHLDFMILDSFCLELALYLAYIIRHGLSNPFLLSDYRNLCVVVFLINFLVVVVFNFFDGIVRRGFGKELYSSGLQAAALFVGITAYLYATHVGDKYSRIMMGLTIVIFYILTNLVRALWKKHLRNKMDQARGDSLLLMAEEEDAPALIRDIRENNYASNRIIGVATKEAARQKELEGIPVVASYADVVEYAKKNWVDEVLVSVRAGEKLPEDVIDTLISMGITVHVNFSRLENPIAAKQMLGTVGSLPVLTMSMNYMRPMERFLKRTVDILAGAAGCVATGIIYLFVAPKIKKESPGPAFFVQTRIGQNGKQFKFYKFRSMYLDAEERKKELMAQNRVKDGMMFKIEFDPRVIGNKIDENGNQVTGIGEFIRKTSLDEFPQFYNVLKGDMSLIGTRPPTLDEFEKYSAHHKARLAARPGITGLWQVSGRSNIMDFEEVVKLDTQYINHWSLGLDLKIMLQTIKVVLKKDGSM